MNPEALARGGRASRHSYLYEIDDRKRTEGKLNQSPTRIEGAEVDAHEVQLPYQLCDLRFGSGIVTSEKKDALTLGHVQIGKHLRVQMIECLDDTGAGNHLGEH